ncbi:MAG: prolyl oligopeptidase family serine peptidase [Chryseobacterium sp.]|jgi:predicted alpha/beta superfamily hydrolase|uniref:alpha/beta hydrolase n=1 Tax=Chryseobacterium sp. TaxID=1871047 RepID=UPI002834AE19|nr:alpha/beta hydrolase-fold protein [Chryseobacterium sp.]MDR2235086.1 prolyl oligopeptidase family serine peptidase [Chryseobacterium sp.]
MNNRLKFLSFILILFFCFPGKGQEKISIGEKQTVFSEILNEKREIWIHLPKTYNDSSINPARYPVIYLLDGEINFEYYTGMSDFLARPPYADIPECIVVGIRNTERTRDLTPTKSGKKSPVNPDVILFGDSGGSENFVKFIQEELKPFINKNYRTQNYSVLVGHSFGGLFAVNVLLTHPEYFNAYVANDPSLWWDNKILISKTKEYLEKNKKFPVQKFLYVSQADNEEQNKNWNSDMTDAIQEFKGIVEQNGTLNYQHHFFENEVHGTVSYPGNYDALRFIFKGFRTDVKKLAKDPQALETEYKKFSEKMGTEFIPSETYLNVILKFMKTNGFKEPENYFINLKSRLYSKPDR